MAGDHPHVDRHPDVQRDSDLLFNVLDTQYPGYKDLTSVAWWFYMTHRKFVICAFILDMDSNRKFTGLLVHPKNVFTMDQIDAYDRSEAPLMFSDGTAVHNFGERMDAIKLIIEKEKRQPMIVFLRDASRSVIGSAQTYIIYDYL